MTYLVLVEPADEHRRGFARWCLDQNPPIMTTSASGSEVPAGLFAAVPDDLLDGAYIDGRPFRPVVEDREPDGDGYRDTPETPVAAKKTAARQRNARKGTST